MKVRKQEHVDEIRNKILDSACQILVEEGLEKLSMRKIATKMEYTQGIIYHYFKNKDELLSAIATAGYMEILTTLKMSIKKDASIENLFIDTLKNYIILMLGKPELFRIMIMSNIESIKDKIDLLESGIRGKRQSIQLLCQTIEAGNNAGIFAVKHVEVRAQCIWCATFGLISRIIMEEPQEELKQELIEEHLKMMLEGLKATL